ncbi:YsaB family lipoprotein [Yokenella regensburgei]|uniref:YsaB family lipoprotein n=1 Tax=Yokenella regensburgei TaxID=158877 RepID=UPI003F1837E0
MMMKEIATALTLLIAGCSAQQTAPEQKAQKTKVSPSHSLAMEQQCRNSAAYRYNTDRQKIAVIGFEQFQSSYEMRGFTPLKERFVCAFDAEGQFLHLSMR